MKVSIIIPVYNAEKYIEECFYSITNQTYKNIEVLFIDDCYPDKSISILNQLKSQHLQKDIRIIKNEHNCGTAISRNKGISLATGEYIFFMDDDDTITPNCIETLLLLARQYNYPDIVVPNVNCPGYSYKAISSNIFYCNKEKIRASFFNNEWYEMPWNKLIKREFILKQKLFFSNIYYEDSVWSLKTALHANTILLIPDYTYNFRRSETQKTALDNNEEKIYNQLISFEEMYCIINNSQYNDVFIYYSNIITNYLSHLFNSIFYKGKDKSYKIYIYKKIRILLTKRNIIESIKSNRISIGIKILMFHRLLPTRLGYLYCKTFNLIHKKYA